MNRLCLSSALTLCLTTQAMAIEPPLPKGLLGASTDDEPVLPTGLPHGNEPDVPTGLPGREPSLPTGLGGDVDPKSDVVDGDGQDEKVDLSLSGFIEARFGMRTQNDRHEQDVSLGETRLQLELNAFNENWSAQVVTDVVIDPVADRYEPRMETGEGVLDLRQAWFSSSVGDHVDYKVGRQVMTWGTGDLFFINDLFPKDWNSFFIGRDEEYLKAPNDAVRINIFTDLVNLDFAYVPNFDADRFLDGRRLSYYNPTLGDRAGQNAIIRPHRPNRWFSDDEIHYRLHRQFGAYEVAAYGYHGFWKSPAGQSTLTGKAIFPKLNVYGASVRGPVGTGIGNIEIGYYDSADDRAGTDGAVDNSQIRFLAGYEQEIATNLTIGVQYYLEYMLDHDGYLASLPAGVPARDEARHVLTARVTYLADNQNLIYSLFAFVSPSDRDAYLRPNVTRKIDDHWTASIGANIFVGADEYTFLNQFSRNTNAYFSIRYSF